MSSISRYLFDGSLVLAICLNIVIRAGYLYLMFGHWLHEGLVTNLGGGATKSEGGHVKFYPYKKGGRWKMLSHSERGAHKVWG